MADMWKYENKTTGAELETNNLPFLLHRLRNSKGLNIPHDVNIDLLTKGEAHYLIPMDGGPVQRISIRLMHEQQTASTPKQKMYVN